MTQVANDNLTKESKDEDAEKLLGKYIFFLIFFRGNTSHRRARRTNRSGGCSSE
jgi:hypothetical protein